MVHTNHAISSPVGLPDKFTVSGYIKDAATGESLIGATIYDVASGSAASTNVYGFYSMKIPAGKQVISVSYLSYTTKSIELDASNDVVLNIDLDPVQVSLDEVVIESESVNERITRTQMSVDKLDSKSISQIPALMGEVDVIKAIQLLPGVKPTAEGGSGFSVRGGSPDQNLILLDEALVYNPSHLMGFFSVFNNEAIKSVELYKGDIPAAYGGRLSSVLDVRMNDGNSRKISGKGGIGTISSRLMLEGPIQHEKSSFMIAARRTYADLFLKLSSDELLRKTVMYFYDFNGKANYIINDKNRLYVSGYTGKDVFKGDGFGMGWGNQTFTMRWNHLFNQALFSNFSVIYSSFNYNLGAPESQPNAFEWTSSMKDLSFKGDFTWFANENSSVRFGVLVSRHAFKPGTAEGKGSDSPFNKIEVSQNQALETGVYISNNHKIGSRLTVNYGLRFSSFSNVGPTLLYHYNEQHQKTDSVNYPKGKFYHTYSGLEPRFSFSYTLNEISSVKGAYTRNMQYVHLAQNSTGGTPLDIWFASGPNVKPQIGDQFSLGYFRHFHNLNLETSVESFYKLNQNAIDFKDHAELLLNQYIEGEFRFGKATSYGLEVLVKRSQGRLNGWVSYTWARTFREIPEINKGRKYSASYDRPHNVSIVLNYEINKRIMLGANWVYATGSPVTFPTGRFVIGSTIAPVYSARNSYRLQDYHRLDLSLTLKGKDKPDKKWQGEWNFSVYNAYFRKNPWVINFISDNDQSDVTHAEKTYLFGIVPSVTYNFHF
jgi:hypothetical protein